MINLNHSYQEAKTPCKSFSSSNLSDSWPDRNLLNATNTWSSFLGGDSDVTFFSPCWSPRVSNDVVLLSVFNSITDTSDGVIKLGSAIWSVDNSTGVSHEIGRFSSDGYWHWSLIDGSNQLFRRVLWDNGDTRNVNFRRSSLLAGSWISITWCIRIFLL